MYNLAQIKELSLKKESAQFTKLEQIVFDYLNPEISLSALENSKDLSTEELIEGLNHYCDITTEKLFMSVLNWNNISVFLQCDNISVTENVKSWILSQEEFKNIKGSLNLKTLSFKLENSHLKIVLEKIKFNIDLSEVEQFIEQLSLLEESTDVTYPATLKWSHNSFILTIGQDQLINQDRTSWWKDNLVKPIQAATIVGMIFTASMASAQDSNFKESDALKYATKAAMAHPDVKNTVDSITKAAEKKAVDMVKESGTEIPVTVVGYGIKVATEQKVQVKGKVPLSLSSPLQYDLAIGFNNSYQMGVSGDAPLIKDATYKIQGSKNGSEQKIEMKLNFDF